MYFISSSTKISLSIHASFIIFFLLIIQIKTPLINPNEPKKKNFKVRVVETKTEKSVIPPTIKEIKTIPNIETKISKNQNKIVSKKPIRQVFGINRQSLTREGIGESSEGLKLGNTLAKSPDKEKLDQNDPTFLPAPAAEFLVSEMPRLISEFRIPYPDLAKKNNIEGPVIMDIYVDSEGNVRECTLVSGPGFGLDEAALEAIKKFKFSPAKVGQENVNFRLRYSYRFVLEK